MKKWIIIAALAIAIVIPIAYLYAQSADVCVSSGNMSNNAMVTNGPGVLCRAIVCSNSINATVIVYDNPATAAGNIVWKGQTGAVNSCVWYPAISARVVFGQRAEITGTNTTYILYYK